MNEQDNRLPPNDTSPEAMERERIRQRDEELRQYWLDPRQDYPEPYYMLEYNGVPFSTIGGIQAIGGQKKNGKSFMLTQLMAAILDTGGERTGQYLPGLRVPERTIEYLGHEPRVLYIDTEMEQLNSAKVLRRVHWLCGWDMKEPNDRFHVLWLKNMPRDGQEAAHKRRWRLTQWAIEAVSPDIVFVDGIRDLLSSINDEETATEILSQMSTMAEERRMCIWNALHQNPRIGGDGEDSKMRGWIGTELGNKVSDTFISIKSKTANGVTFTVKQQDARGKDVDDWKYEITDDAGSLGVPHIINSGFNLPSKSKEQAACDDASLIRSWIEQAMTMYEWPMDRKGIKSIFREIGGVKNNDRLQADLISAINLGYLKETTMKKNGYPMLQPPDDLPF